MAQPTTVDRHGLMATWENCYHGGHCFLVLGGPSIHRVVPDLRLLQDRGIATFGVNNVSAAIRTNFWTYGDSTRKFHDAIWKDPGIIKLVPYPKMDNPIFSKPPDGPVASTNLRPRTCAGIVGIYRNSDLQPDTYLFEETVNWGVGAESLCDRLRPWMQENLDLPEAFYQHKDKTKKISKGEVNWWRVESSLISGRLPRAVYDRLCPHPKVLSTMFQAVRLVYYLGFRNCYLLGADFTMTEEQRYSFDESGNPGTVRGNNGAYPKINTIFNVLRPEFDKAGFRVFQLNPESQLTAFDYLSWDDAYGWAREDLPAVIDTKGWYEKD